MLFQRLINAPTNKAITAITATIGADKAVITYVYGDEKETIDWGTISNWIVFENGEGYLSEQLIREYVMSIGQKYNTIYYNRSFNTSLGTTIQFGESENN